MITLNGKGQGESVVLACAAALRWSEGRPTLEPELIARAGRIARRGDEPLDIILVAESGYVARFFPLPPGLNLVGIVAQEDTPLFRPPVPALVGVTEALAAISEGTLLLLDPKRGRVLVEPEAREVARIQAGPHRARYRIGSAHTPARTQGGREIAVWSVLYNLSDLDMAMDEGADGLFVEPFGDLLSDEENVLNRLLTVAEQYGGGDIAVAAGPDLLDVETVVSLSGRSYFHWAISPDRLSAPLAMVRKELEEVCREMTEGFRPAGIPRLAANSPDLTAGSVLEYDEVFVPAAILSQHSLDDIFALPPVFAILSEDMKLLDGAVRQGVVGVVVSPDRVKEVKDLIRGLE